MTTATAATAVLTLSGWVVAAWFALVAHVRRLTVLEWRAASEIHEANTKRATQLMHEAIAGWDTAIARAELLRKQLDATQRRRGAASQNGAGEKWQ